MIADRLRRLGRHNQLLLGRGGDGFISKVISFWHKRVLVQQPYGPANIGRSFT
jgi:hypothetical protein